MKQVFQNLRNGRLTLEELPMPQVRTGHLVIQTECSLISAGTERMLVEFGRGSYLRKAKSQPEKVRQVLQKIRTDGLIPAVAAVRRKLAIPMPLGYSQAGRVIAVGPGVLGFHIGDRVASNGAHAEVVQVPAFLTARVPAAVASEDACFTVVGSIALHGCRLLETSLGETHLVLGLGLIGQLAVQVLLASGCRVLALDKDPAKVALAERFGATGIAKNGGDPLRTIHELTNGIGVDGVLIAASTSSDAPILLAAESCRHRGRVVLVGVVGLSIPRDPFFKKEIRFQVSCSYGPGRYDPAYELGGHDYPIGFVRWTEQRNFQAFLGLLESGKVQTAPLRNLAFPIEHAPQAYAQLMNRRELMGILLSYPNEAQAPTSVVTTSAPSPLPSADHPGIAFIGAGNHATAVLLPSLERCVGHRRRIVISEGGISAVLAANRFGFELAGSDFQVALDDPFVNAVFIVTRHDSHADLAIRALEAGKHVFVEKPLATTAAQLAALRTVADRYPGQVLMVGFNRRYAPMSVAINQALAGRTGPLLATCSINAGAVPAQHWVHDRAEGGGRILGEACHFVDLLRHWVGHPLESLEIRRARNPVSGTEVEDIALLTLTFRDGSLGSIHYFSNGHRSAPKERYSLAWEGRQAEVVNWRSLRFTGGGRNQSSYFNQNKGHVECMQTFFQACNGRKTIDRNVYFEINELLIESRAY